MAVTTRPAAGGALRPRPSSAWIEHFEASRADPPAVEWTAEAAALAPDERAAVADSIRAFQLGEQAEGRHFGRCAKEHAEAAGDPDYARARLFIAEEQRHSRDLGRFMALAGIPPLERTWTDTFFRKLRHLGGLEVAVATLVSAEIVAQVYYAALRDATRSPALRAICARILRDEAQHVEFQSERLAILRRARSGPAIAAALAAQAVLFWGAALAAYIQHRRALRRGGRALFRYLSECRDALAAALSRMDPRRYAIRASRAASR